MPDMNTADLFVRCLEAEGVEYVFGIPGEENLDFLDSLRRSKKIKLILTRHEQAAGFMATTIGRLTGKAGVALSTLGPGATNFATSAAYAQLGAMPVMFITGQKPIKKSKQGRFQIVDIVEMMRPMTKLARQIISGETVAASVREAFRAAEEERPGAVHLELPEDIAREKLSDDHQPIPPHAVRRPAPDSKAIEAAVALLRDAKRPLLMIGAGANRKQIGNALVELLEATGMPFVNTQLGKGIVPKAHDKYIGTCALSACDFVHAAIAKADVIVNVGHDVIEKPPFFMEHGGTPVVHVNFSTAVVDEVYFPQVEVVGDIAASLRALAGALGQDTPSWDFAPLLAIKEQLQAHVDAKAADPRFPIIPQRAVADVRAVMPEDGIIALDNGVYKVWFARNYRAYRQNTVLLDNALATMGAGLPSGMAAKMVHPDRAVLSICGDGGFMMNSQELETAVRLGLDLTVLILNDNAFGMIKWKQAGEGLPSFGLDYGNPDFVKYAQSYGAQGYRIESADGLQEQLRACLATPGVHVIDCPIDYSENDEIQATTLAKLTAGL